MSKRLVVLFAGFLILTNCNGNKKAAAPAAAPKEDPGYISGLAKMGKLATDPFTQMALTFDGNPAPEDIHERLDSVLTKYGMELTDSNRSLAAKTLTGLRKEMGHSEMDILQGMLAAPTNDEKFDDGARRVSTSMNP